MYSSHTPTLIVLIFLIGLSACKKEEQAPEGPDPDPGIELSPEIAGLVSSLEDIYFPLSSDPSLWEDEELAFLDSFANTTIFGMGEATHGTAEFFQAKARVFQYLVEHHGYRVFAIEADMAECMIINEAIREGEVDDLELLMMEKMVFWTWKTDEVRELLNWMVRFNRGRDADDKISYVGVDCQIMDYTVPMLLNFLQDAGFPQMEEALIILNRVQSNEDYSTENYETDILELQRLREWMLADRVNLEAASSEWDFLQYYRLTEVVSQCAELNYVNSDGWSGLETRDRYMAENTAWYSENLGPRVFAWAHNYHISKRNIYEVKAMGYMLDEIFGDGYTNVGFGFARGYFNSHGRVNGGYRELEEQWIEVVEDELSLNWIFSQAGAPNFFVNMNKLKVESIWGKALDQPLNILGMGSSYDQILSHCYSPYMPKSFDHLIFIEETTASVLL